MDSDSALSFPFGVFHCLLKVVPFEEMVRQFIVAFNQPPSMNSLNGLPCLEMVTPPENRADTLIKSFLHQIVAETVSSELLIWGIGLIGSQVGIFI